MKRKLIPEASANYLRSARPRLILRAVERGLLLYNLMPCIRLAEPTQDEIISEGYDPVHSPLGCPVYFRVVNRGNSQIYCSTYLATRTQVIHGWGPEGVAYCDAITGMALARIETLLRGGWPPGYDRELKEWAAFRMSKGIKPDF
jgi:hypothetical protein